MKKLSRNDPCPCNSGKKYKHCCYADKKSLNTPPPSRNRAHHEAIQVALKHHRAGRLLQAKEIYYQILREAPSFPDALHFLGMLLHQTGEHENAVELMRKSISISPQNPNYCSNLGLALQQQNKLDEAVRYFRKALSIKPDCAETIFKLGTALQSKGEIDAAIEFFQKALSIKADYLEAHNNLLFTLSQHPQRFSTEYLAQARIYGQKVANLANPYTQWQLSSCIPNNKQPLRVGIVSGDLRSHPVGFFIESLLAHLNPSKTELIAYSTTHQEDDHTARIKQHFVAWNIIAGLNDEAASQKIHGDGIQILIDLEGHTAHTRLPLFAWKPAPVQVSWLGYWASTGVQEIDYVLADPVSLPKSHQWQFTETIWYLSDSRFCFTPPAEDNASLPHLREVRDGHVTFACFQNLSKINSEVLAAWGKIFKAMPEAHLRLQNKQLSLQTVREQLQQDLTRHGIPAERVIMKEATPRENYLAAYNEVDIILDTFPYPGGTTTCEALWMGVPTLTLAGDSMLARQGASLLTCVGLEDWIAHNTEDYVTLALAHASDSKQLDQLRSILRPQLLASPLCNASRFAYTLENALQEMWQTYCAKRNSTSLAS